MCAPASACATRDLAVALERARRCPRRRRRRGRRSGRGRCTRPGTGRDDHDGVVAELLAHRAERRAARCRRGSTPPSPRRPCASGTPNSMNASTPRSRSRRPPCGATRPCAGAGRASRRSVPARRALLHEQRRDQIRGTHVGLPDQLAERGGPPQTPRPLLPGSPCGQPTPRRAPPDGSSTITGIVRAVFVSYSPNAGMSVHLAPPEVVALGAARDAGAHRDRLDADLDRGLGVRDEVVVPVGVRRRAAFRREDHVRVRRRAYTRGDSSAASRLARRCGSATATSGPRTDRRRGPRSHGTPG